MLPLSQANNWAFGGWILRDRDALSKFWGSANLGITSTRLEDESKALLVATQNVRCKGFKKVMFEDDCQNLVKTLRRSPWRNFNHKPLQRH